MHPSRIMDAQREQMIALGLKHFETEDDCRRRQAEMVERLVANGMVSNIGQIASCSAEKCSGLAGCQQLGFRQGGPAGQDVGFSDK